MKVTGYKINNNKKSVALLYTNEEWTEKLGKHIAPFTVASNNIKYLGVTLNKQAKDLNDKSFQV